MKKIFVHLVTVIVSIVSLSQTGNIGIGITNPSNKLQIGVVPTGITGNDFAIGNGLNGMSFSQSTGSGWFTSTYFTLMPGVSGTGYVGIGTMFPGNRLQIGNLPSGIIGNDLAIGNGANAMSFFQSSTSNWYTTTNFALMPGIGGTGNVGIGTSTPAVRLHINGTGEVLRLQAATPVLGFHDAGGNYKGYMWYNGANDIDVGTSAVNTNGNLSLSIRGTSALTVQSDLRVRVGANQSVFSAFFLGQLPAFTVNGGLAIKRTSSPFEEWTFYNHGNLVLDLNGGPKAWVDNGGEWNVFSDIDLKENITSFKSVLEGIKMLNVSTYLYKSNPQDKRSFGLIAQNVALYFPEIVSETKYNDGRKLLGIAYSKTGVLALKGIQEQQVIIEEQQKKIEELIPLIKISQDQQKRIELLEERLSALERK